MMDKGLHQHTKNLRNALLELKATGAEGFEGLLAVTLTEICGVPFRLAASGSQFGIDGKGAYIDDGVCFEGKRYDGDIPINEVLSKLAELSIEESRDIDLWVLGTTTALKTQQVDKLRRFGTQNGIGVLILDWNENALPPLAIALTTAQSEVEKFLKSNLPKSNFVTGAIAAMAAISQDPDFAEHSARIRAEIFESTVGIGLARQQNRDWLLGIFSDRKLARKYLGQPLCPGANSSSGEILSRGSLEARLQRHWVEKADSEVVVILGNEGNGKSWLVAQTWLSLPEKPLMLLFTADEFVGQPSPTDLEDCLVKKLITQTGRRHSEALRKQWLRKFKRWRYACVPDSPRLVVVIDGLNQRPNTDWCRLIEALDSELAEVDGRVVVTSRTGYYHSHIQRRLFSSAIEFEVPEWSEAECDQILAARGIKSGSLSQGARAFLRNPRLLGIALELLENERIEELEELTVSRLLFEHIRVSERDSPSPRPAHEFARKLSDHARRILDCGIAQISGSSNLFDGGLEAVSDERFFVSIDPTRYRLRDDGLTLALGFALVDEVRLAERQGRDQTEGIRSIVEPISTLDQAAAVVLAAVMVATLDPDCSLGVGAALACAFAEVQNPNVDDFPAFSALVKGRPEPFMETARCVCMASMHPLSFDWIEEALHDAAKDADAWNNMFPLVRSWLAYYSLSPRVEGPLDTPVHGRDRVDGDQEKQQKEIDEKVSALSSSERALLKTLVRNDGNLARLSRLAFSLMAKNPLAPLARSLAYWSFSNALNGRRSAPYADFFHVVRLNRVDWRETRQAILNTCRDFEAVDASRTAKWALVNLLRATGDPQDAARAMRLYEELTAHLPKFPAWRLVENYCSTDPCDPGSEKPENVTETAKKYAGIDASMLHCGRSRTEADLFLVMARPGIARFEAEVGIVKHREFIADVAQRSGIPLRQGVYALLDHNALVTRPLAEKLINRVKAGTAGVADQQLREEDRQAVSQYHQLVAFPLLTAHEQIETLLVSRSDEVLINLLRVAKPLSRARFQKELKNAVADGDAHAQFVLLLFGRHSRSPTSPKIRSTLQELTQSDDERVRAQALALIATVNDESSIDLIARRGWSAASFNQSDTGEVWCGSHVILQAARRGVIPHFEALSRITPQLYGYAAQVLGPAATRDVAQLIDASIRRAADLDLNAVVPDIEVSRRTDDPITPPRYFANDRPARSFSSFDYLRLLSESDQSAKDREQRLVEAFNAFRAELTKGKAEVILDNLRLEEFDLIAAANPDLAETWFDLFVELHEPALARVHNLGLLLAHAMSHTKPEKSATLFKRLEDSEPLVRITHGRAAIPLNTRAIWSAKDETLLNDLRFARLDRAGNDDILATEVLAALVNGKEYLVLEYIEQRLKMGNPAAVARALMTAGFGLRCDFNGSVIARYKDTAGFLGRTQIAARYAYERNGWSEHWFSLMAETEKTEDFWRYSILLEKIVDPRFDVWGSRSGHRGEPFRSFWPSVEDQLQFRYQKWRRHREKNLFGEEAPARIFLQ